MRRASSYLESLDFYRRISGIALVVLLQWRRRIEWGTSRTSAIEGDVAKAPLCRCAFVKPKYLPLSKTELLRHCNSTKEGSNSPSA